MNFRIDWIDGAPERLEPGMVVQFSGGILLYGNGITEEQVVTATGGLALRHGYLVKPHELEWIADMAQRHGKGRPEE